MQNEVRVGDVVGWSHVPRGALAKSPSGDYVLRIGDMCRYFALPAKWLEHLGPLELSPSQWSAGRPSVPMTIIALNLTGQETAADLRRLAEVYEIREHLISTGDDSIWFGEEIDELAPRLQAVGWKPGMTAEDAARLLK